MNELHKELFDMIKTAEPSQIPPGRDPVPIVPEKPSLENIGTLFWGLKSLGLQSDFRHGFSLGKFNNDSLTTKQVLNTFSDAIRGVLINQYAKNNISSDSIKLHIQVLDNIIQLIAKDIESKQFKDYSPESLIAGMHGFITAYSDKQKR